MGRLIIRVASPIVLLLLVLIPIEFSSAQEGRDTVEICSPASTVVIATDGGVVDISALDESEVARVVGAKGSTDSIVAELKDVCGFTSFVLIDGNGSQGTNSASAIGTRSSDKYTDPVADAILDACNYSVAIVEVQQDDICVDIPACGDDRGFVWSDNNGYLWSGDRGYLWSGNRGYLWSGARGYLWSGVRANPGLESNSNPWFDVHDACIDDQGYLWSGDRGYLWSGDRGYLWSGVRGYLWSGDR